MGKFKSFITMGIDSLAFIPKESESKGHSFSEKTLNIWGSSTMNFFMGMEPYSTHKIKNK